MRKSGIIAEKAVSIKKKPASMKINIKNGRFAPARSTRKLKISIEKRVKGWSWKK